MKGVVASTAGLSPLLLNGIGDTIRVSLTPTPGGDRSEEVRCGQRANPAVPRHPQLYAPGHLLPRLRSDHLHLLPEACRRGPGLPRRIHARVEAQVRRRRGDEARRHGLCQRQRPRRVEARQHRHPSLPGTFEDPVAPVYVDGKLSTTLRGDNIIAEFRVILDQYVDSHYGKLEQRRARQRQVTPFGFHATISLLFTCIYLTPYVEHIFAPVSRFSTLYVVTYSERPLSTCTVRTNSEAHHHAITLMFAAFSLISVSRLRRHVQAPKRI